MSKKIKNVIGILLFFVALLIVTIPTSVKAASSSDFLIKDGVLVAYTGSSKTVVEV